jgi:hypothetical protein
LGQFSKIIELSTHKIVTKLSKIWVWDPGSGKNLFRIPDSGVKKAPDPRSATLSKSDSSIQQAAVHYAKKYFLLNGYKLYHNSESRTRGVGILINGKIPNAVDNVLEDLDGNLPILEIFLGQKSDNRFCVRIITRNVF